MSIYGKNTFYVIDFDKARRMALNGATVREMAEAQEVPTDTFRYRLEKHCKENPEDEFMLRKGKKKRKKNEVKVIKVINYYESIDKGMVLALFKARWTIQGIADETQTDVKTVLRVLNEDYGLGVVYTGGAIE